MAVTKDNVKSSVGLVETQTLALSLPVSGFVLGKGGILHEIHVAYEAYGELSSKHDNVVYICTALTGDAHVAGYHGEYGKNEGWWEQMVGPGKGIDTNYYHVICANILGGCKGTTGPSSVNPETGKPFGSSFPEITVTDIVRVQKMFLEGLGINHLAAVIGGSFGGMQVVEWSIQYPDAVDRCVCIATGLSLSAQALAFDVVACDAITSDPNWHGGDYYDKGVHPEWGLAHARKIGHITYLSPEIMQEKFGREKTGSGGLSSGKECFQVERYLEHQGKKLVERFDANSYLRITRAMDLYSLEEEYGSAEKAFENVKAKFLVIGLSSDWLFPPEQSAELANVLLRAGRHVSCCTLSAPHGHDAFLLDIEHLSDTVKAFLPWVGKARDEEKDIGGNREYEIIIDQTGNGAKVVDLGCGDGKLLSLLRDIKNTSGLGVDIDLDNVVAVLNRGHDVSQGNLDNALSIFPDQSYDYAILGSTLQQVRNPRLVLREMTRIAREGIVTFPNFAYWQNRVSIGLRGRMPKTSALPYEWYDTPNIHLATRNDFIEICRREGIRILDLFYLSDGGLVDNILLALKLNNLGALKVVARITRA